MNNDKQLLIGTWTVSLKEWIWEYEFLADGSVTWRDTRGPKRGTGRWAMTSSLVNLSWNNSATKESWRLPLNAGRNNNTWCSASYYTGPYQIERRVDRNLPKTQGPDDTIEIDTGDPHSEANYIDTLCTHVGYGIYNGGFYVYVPASYTYPPILIPENLVFFNHSGLRVSDEIFDTQADAIRAAGGVSPARIAYYRGVGGKIICPTAFTYNTAPTIVNTASIVVDELVMEVQEELKDLMLMLALRVAISTTGSIVSRSGEVRQLKARDARAKTALENARQARARAVTTVPTLRPGASPAQLREMLSRPDDWYVWATEDAGIVENQAITFQGKTNFAANQKVHLLRGNEGIKGLKYGPNKVAIRIGSRHISRLVGNEYLVDEIGATEGLHFHQTDLPGL